MFFHLSNEKSKRIVVLLVLLFQLKHLKCHFIAINKIHDLQ